MAAEMMVVSSDLAQRKIDTVVKLLAALATAIYAFLPSHPHVAAIIAFVATVVALISGKRVIAFIRWMKKWTVGLGKHRGLYVTALNAETIPPSHYLGTTIRKCASDAVSCGSRAAHNKEFWP